MTNILLCGCNGYMGRVITSCVNSRDNLEIVAGIDLKVEMNSSYPVFSTPLDFHGEADVIIDFSHPSALSNTLEFAVQNNIPAVIATTGFSKEQIDQLLEIWEEDREITIKGINAAGEEFQVTGRITVTDNGMPGIYNDWLMVEFGPRVEQRKGRERASRSG